MQASNLPLEHHASLPAVRTQATDHSSPLPLCFVGLCLYFLSQGYLVPLAAIGPSWAIWPRIADFAGLFMAGACLWQWRQAERLPKPLATITFWLMVFLWLSAISLIAQTIISPKLYWNGPRMGEAVQWGIYQLARLIQFIALFVCAAYTPLTETRRRWLVGVSTTVLWFVIITVLLTYTGTITYESVVAHLPESPDVSGPWASFGESFDGLGYISYNHAYTAVQLVLLFSLHLSLTRCQFNTANLLLLVAVSLGVFLSGSRAGFAAMLVLVAPCLWTWVRRGGILPLVWAGTVGCTIFATMLIAPSFFKVRGLTDFKQQIEDLVVRQTSTFEGYKSDNLAGRTDIWKWHLDSLEERPWTWVVGYGFGSAITRGNQAHMQPLNMVSEMGLIGLGVGLVLMVIVLKTLWEMEPPGHPYLWGSLALLFTSLTQETFYPVAAMGHFPGFYLFGLAICLRLAIDLPPTPELPQSTSTPATTS
ncbi:O-antigen ligase family protein [Bremerella cremea]|uniref:O-antigen ligase family protein n=1 Tax=Bremerella cremea TaxID=1031537 RepID=UPI0031F003EB